MRPEILSLRLGADLVAALPSWDEFPLSAWPALVALFALALFLLRRGYRHREWMHPLVAPLGYIALVMVVPLLYLQATRISLGPLRAQDLTRGAVAMMSITVVTVLVGILLGLAIPVRHQDAPRFGTDWDRVRTVGRVGLVACVLLRAQYAITHPSSLYGRNQLNYDFTDSVQSAVSVGILIAVVLVVVGNLSSRRRVLLPFDAAFIGLYAIASLYTGSRFSIIGPAIFLAWAYHAHVKRLSFPTILLATLVGVACLQLVGTFRGAGRVDATAHTNYVAVVLVNLSSPLYVTNEVIRRVPRLYPYADGSTYVAALKRQLPGPVANRLFGPPTDTGAYRFRVIEGDYNPDQGYSFALPAEGYLNFGQAGVVGAGIVLGFLLGVAWTRSNGPPTRPREIVYPLILAAIPYGLRSDALTQIKLIVTPVIVIAVVLALCRLSRFGGVSRAVEGETLAGEVKTRPESTRSPLKVSFGVRGVKGQVLSHPGTHFGCDAGHP